jgi:hypothetical protein
MIITYKEFPSGKQYACIKEGDTQIFLRNIAFLVHPKDHSRIVTVREWGAKGDEHVWEPPKGQMEWKEFAAAGFRRGQTISPTEFMRVARAGLLRELAEEAKIKPQEIRDFQPLPLSYTQPSADQGTAKAPAKFRYQFWWGVVTPTALAAAQKRMAALVEHPETWSSITPDKKEKDAVDWWKPTSPAAWRRIRGGFSLTMTQMYYNLWLKHDKI